MLSANPVANPVKKAAREDGLLKYERMLLRDCCSDKFDEASSSAVVFALEDVLTMLFLKSYQ